MRASDFHVGQRVQLDIRWSPNMVNPNNDGRPYNAQQGTVLNTVPSLGKVLVSWDDYTMEHRSVAAEILHPTYTIKELGLT